MNDNSDMLRDRQLEMVGRLLAGFTHELKNHLAIIKESNGLIGDLISMGRVENQALRERLEKITETINRRTLVIAEMAKHLNGFAHRNDTPTSPFQLHDVLNEEIAFLTRFANLKSIGLSISFPNALPAVFSNPGIVQFIFGACFLHILPALKPGGKILIFSGQQNRLVSFGLQTEGDTADDAPSPDAVDHDEALQMALKHIGASLSLTVADGRITTLLCSVPLS